MLKFIKNHVTSIIGIEIYPIISFVMFFLFFVVMTIWVVRSRKEYMDEVSKLPLED